MIAAEAQTSNSPGNSPVAPSAESLLRADLARARATQAAVPQVLGQLLATDHDGLFSEEVLAHTRGVLDSLALEMLREVDRPDGESLARLTAALAGESALLGHCHALALEWQLTERLQRESRVDPVLSTQVQNAIADPDGERAALGMGVLAAQARFVQAQRRMQSSLAEVPADLLHLALFRLAETCGERGEVAGGIIRARHDEGRGRCALMTRLLLSLDEGFTSAINPGDAGVALFVTALSLATGLPRDRTIVAAAAGQSAVLATMLIASGMERDQAAKVLLVLQPDIEPPAHCLSTDRAGAMALLVGIVA